MFKKLFSGFQKKTDRVSIETKSSLVPIQQGSFLEFALGYGSNLPGYNRLSHQQAWEFYRKSSAISTGADMIAEEIEYIQPVLQMPDGSLENNHEILDRLQVPNAYQTRTEFFGALSRHTTITNNFYTYMSGLINRPPLELFAVPPQTVSTTENSIGFPGNFLINSNILGNGSYNEMITPKGAKYYDGNMKELYHMSGFSSQSNEMQGESALLAICLEIHQQILGNNHNVSLLENGGRLSLLITFKDNAPDEDLRLRKSYLEDSFAGSKNAGGIATINSDSTEIQEMGLNNKDMDYAELQKMSNNAIYLRLKIPLPLISTDASTFNNVKTAVEMLYDRAVIPQYKRIANNLTRMLMPRYGLDPTKYKITYNPDDITALIPRRLENLKLRKEIGIETPNEMREDLPNREPKEGGDVIYQNASLVPQGQDLTAGDL